MLLNLLPTYWNIKLRARPGCNTSSLFGWFCSLAWPSPLCGCFYLFAWFVNCTSFSLSQYNWCGTILWILFCLLNYLKQLNFWKRGFWVWYSTMCVWFSSLDMRSPEVHWSTCADSERSNIFFTLVTWLDTWLLVY